MNSRIYVAGLFWTPGPPSEQTCQGSTRQCYILNFKHLIKMALKNKIFNILLCISMVATCNALAPGPSCKPGGLDSNKLGKRPLGIATFQASEPIGSEEDGF